MGSDTEGADVLAYDPETRNSFVRLVMIIVMVMLICTVIFVVIILLTPQLNIWFKDPYGVFILVAASIVSLAVGIAMACFDCTTRPPINYICLVISWLAMSLICTCLTVKFDTRIVLYALVATVVTVIVCIILASTKFDFTRYMLYFIAISVAVSVIFIIILIVMKFTGTYMKTVHIVILFVVTILDVVFLIMDLQMVLGGRSVELNEDEYILGAYFVYNSIVDIFINLLKLLGLLLDFDIDD